MTSVNDTAQHAKLKRIMDLHVEANAIQVKNLKSHADYLEKLTSKNPLAAVAHNWIL